ncbi:PucR C-terminal helix-turn-helix domain-containing protein [Actinopolyspora mzabensis]|uniref:PucR C-terminal helix-turn-helix domain-containing protein n=1 Tax=Actinopolyspora mzabensis TaxID=995066 RepID=A0A1G8Z9N6_ACTMZ|nr:helix-turn-helix domain-containing protein [Actinopolyspora mzabensis]SDK11703.1 PucR C-terminal helix-turn-helix domain-containing protein [Actinopolyspora mzabensis]
MPKLANSTESTRLWAALPDNLATLLRPEIPSLATQILTEIQRRIPEYARPLDQHYVHAIRRGIEEALTRFVDRIAEPSTPLRRCAEVHRALGKAEMREGRSLDSLQAAYRIGARLAWRRVAGIGERIRLAPRTTLLLGEAIFAHIDELTALAVEGYAAAQARAAGTLARRRRRLLELLVSEPQPAQRTIEEAAVTAQWRVPRQVTVAALERYDETRAGTGTPLARWNALVDLECVEPHVLLPSDHGEPDEIEWDTELAGWRVVVGSPVALDQAGKSLRWCRRMMGLIRSGVWPDQHINRCHEDLSSILLLQDEHLIKELARQRLAPLSGLRPKQRTRLAATLLSWLQTRGGAPEIAQRLRVHPQTVRYRLRQLDELFGEALHDPESRFDMEIVLRASNMLSGDTEDWLAE